MFRELLTSQRAKTSDSEFLSVSLTVNNNNNNKNNNNNTNTNTNTNTNNNNNNNKYRKSHDLEYNLWLIGTSDSESSQNCTSLKARAIWEFSKSWVPIIHELYEKVVWFFIYSTFNKITNCKRFKFAAYMLFPWKLNRYSYRVQFGINCTALDQSKLSNFVECTIIYFTDQISTNQY